MPDYEMLRGYHFKVEFLDLPGVVQNDIRFQDVGGLSAEMGIEELQEGGENRFTHRLPTRAKYGNLILKRAMLTDSGLIKWFTNAIENFEFSPSTVHVHLLEAEHEPKVTWNFIKAWPIKWTISDFKATDNAIAIETIELAYQYFRRSS